MILKSENMPKMPLDVSSTFSKIMRKTTGIVSKFAVLFALLWTASGTLYATDTDNDGISDAVENGYCTSDTSIKNQLFTEDFGTGSRTDLTGLGYTVLYSDLQGVTSGNTNDDHHTIINQVTDAATWAPTYWNQSEDHTPNDTNGRMLIVNGKTANKVFYRKAVTVTNDTNVIISFYVKNVYKDTYNAVQPTITYTLLDSSGNQIGMETKTVGPVLDDNTWYTYSMALNALSNTSVTVVLSTNGGNGDDFAIDDIVIENAKCDNDGDNVANMNDLDSDNDGILDANETDADEDRDGLPNFVDIDADGDGIVDNIEAQATNNYTAPNGTVDAQGRDTAYGNSGLTPVDSDSDGTSDYLDLYSDDDGDSDALEGWDTDNNRKIDGSEKSKSGVDADNDGLDDGYDNDDTHINPTNGGQTPQSFPDLDRPHHDRDWREAPDTDDDGVIDVDDLDDDNDGIPDSVECTNHTFAWSNEPTINNTTATGTINGVNYTYESNDTLDISDYLYKYDYYFGPNTVNASYNIPKQKVIKNIYSVHTTLKFDTPLENPMLVFASLGRADGGANDIHVPVKFSHNIDVLYDNGSPNITIDGPKQITGFEGNTIIKFHGTFTSLTFDITVQEVWNNFIFGGEISNCDTDGDGINDDLDLDSDNDGIPDNIEAQTTAGYVAPSGIDSDGDGLDDAYDDNDTNSSGAQPPIPDTDGDGIPDYKDPDSDNDGISDCEEGVPDSVTGKLCPIDDSNATLLGSNGMANWAEANGVDNNYTDVNGQTDQPDPDGTGGGNLQDDNATNHEAAYREFVCGKAQRSLTAMHWVVVSVPCKTDGASISDLFSGSLGTYGEPEDGGHWVMYRQNTQYTGENTSDMEKMLAGDPMVQGKGYWLITDQNVTMELNRSVVQGVTPTQPKGNYSVGASDNGFTKVFAPYSLPNSQSDRKTKVMLGNPFALPIHSGRIYYDNDSMSAYDAFANITTSNSYVENIFYTHDDPDRGEGTRGQNVSGVNPGKYDPVVPAGTPGFGDAINPMVGYWILLKKDSGTHITGNKVIMPFEH